MAGKQTLIFKRRAVGSTAGAAAAAAAGAGASFAFFSFFSFFSEAKAGAAFSGSFCSGTIDAVEEADSGEGDEAAGSEEAAAGEVEAAMAAEERRYDDESKADAGG